MAIKSNNTITYQENVWTKVCFWCGFYFEKWRTREILEIEYSEFRKKFAKEIQVAFDSFRQTELNKPFYNYKDDNSIEFNFYFQIRYNFNNFGNLVWYIEKM